MELGFYGAPGGLGGTWIYIGGRSTRLQAIVHIRDQRNSNNFHAYKKIDLIINSKFIDPNKHTAKELHHMDLQETIVLRI